MGSTIKLAAPHNWCDRRCERCPLSTTCPIPGLPDRQTEEILGEAVDFLEAICRERGIDPAAPPQPPESIDARVLGEAGRGWARAFMALEPAVADAPIRSVVVAGKVARIAAEKDLDDADLWSYDTVPNLLVGAPRQETPNVRRPPKLGTLPSTAAPSKARVSATSTPTRRAQAPHRARAKP